MSSDAYELTKEEARGSFKLFLLLISCIILFALPMSGFALNSNELMLGVPLSVWSIFLASAYLTLTTIAAYKFLFKPWAERIDKEV